MLSVVALLLLLRVYSMNTTTTSMSTRKNARSEENLVTAEEVERQVKRAKTEKPNADEMCLLARTDGPKSGDVPNATIDPFMVFPANQAP